MNIALITPPYDMMKKGYGVKTKKVIRAGLFPPLGVGYLASPLLKDGHKVKIIDCASLGYDNFDAEKELKVFNPEIIGVSSLSASKNEAYSLIKHLKKKFSKVPIIFGGVHVTCFPEDVIRAVPEVDCLVFGEGEKTFKEIIDSFLARGEIRSDIKGIWYKNNEEKFIKNIPQEPLMNLDEILAPAYHLYDYKNCIPLPLQYKKLPVANMITSRGCPWGRCAFCFESGKASQKYRRNSPGRVISEIKTLLDLGIKEIAFWDDNFLINQNWIFEFCDLLDKENIKIPWSAYGRVNTVSKAMLERAKKSGLWSVFYGFETGNEELLKRINKGATLDQARSAAKWTNDLDMDMRGSFMIALPGETPEMAQKTIDFAIELDIPFAQFLPTFPEWGTALYDDAIENGMIVPEYQGRTQATYVPSGYKDAEEVRLWQKKAYKSFYFRPRFFWKHFKKLRSFDKIKQYYLGFKYILGIS